MRIVRLRGILIVSVLAVPGGWTGAVAGDSCHLPCPPEQGRPAEGMAVVLEGLACYYSDSLEGRKTANGEIFRQSLLTAAHRTLPFGTLVEVKSRATGRSVLVKINDRGPFGGNFVIDLSRAAAKAIGVDTARDRTVTISVMPSESPGETNGERAAGSGG